MTSKVLHMDFFEISADKPIEIEVPIELVGTPIGVSQGAGTLEYLIRSVRLKCLPADVVEVLPVDVTSLDLKEQLLVKDMDIDREKFEVMIPSDIAICNVAAPRVSGKGGAGDDDAETVEGEADEEAAAVEGEGGDTEASN